MRRYEFTTANRENTVQFVGGIGRYDVFWIPEQRRLYLKFSNTTGASFYYSMREKNPRWMRSHGAAHRHHAEITQDIHDTAMAMYTCFVHDKREPETTNQGENHDQPR